MRREGFSDEAWGVLKRKLEDHDIKRTAAVKLVDSLMRDGILYSPRPGYYRRAA